MIRKSNPDEPFRVLVVDDHASARESVADVLRQAGYDTSACASGIEAIAQLSQKPVDVVITDLQMPGMDGLEFIREIERHRFGVQVLMITAHASVASVVEAMRHGAFDYLEKPFDVVKLERSVAQACDRRRLYQVDVRDSSGSIVNEAASATPSAAAPLMIGSSLTMQELRRRISQVAMTDETVLICGESGTGKELVAQMIHALSHRAGGPLISLNCPVLSAQLTESELFGHKRGAFTGAEADRIGRFELAHGGSILLDEVTEIDLGLQAKLLRVLQERTIERVGSSETIAVNVRILATTNRNLASEIAASRFREDLYYRLAVVPIVLPPLRERGEDVLELVDYFLTHAAIRLKRPQYEIEPAARDLLVNHHWPGNVRELQNIITRACVLNQGQTIRADELRFGLSPGGCDRRNQIASNDSIPTDRAISPPLGITLEEMERRMIVATLDQFDGHRGKTADALGIGVRTLSGKLRMYGYAPRERDFAKAG